MRINNILFFLLTINVTVTYAYEIGKFSADISNDKLIGNLASS